MTKRINKIRALVSEVDKRENKASWKAIFDDVDLEPPTNSINFENDMFEFLLEEMKNNVGQKKSITPVIGRYIFAVFSWHRLEDFPEKAENLKTMAAVFQFKIDPQENELQKMSNEDRLRAMAKKFEEDDVREGEAFFKTSIGLLISAVLAILFYFRRKLGL